MRAVIQRVTHASVTIDGNVKSKIGNGFLILLGVEATDSSEDVDWLVRKVAALRVFDDENGVMNRSLIDVDGEALVVSQERQPPVMAACRYTRHLCAALRRVLHKAVFCLGQARWNGRIWCRHEGRVA